MALCHNGGPQVVGREGREDIRKGDERRDVGIQRFRLW